MLKKITALFCAAVAAVALAGCSSVQSASVDDFNGQKVVNSGTPVKHISATTHGLYLLWIPLITGSTSNYGVPTLLEDTVSPSALSEVVTREAKAAGASKTLDLVTNVSSTGFIFYYNYGTASGTAVK